MQIIQMQIIQIIHMMYMFTYNYTLTYKIRSPIKFYLGQYRLLRVLDNINHLAALKIVVGSSKVYEDGWIPASIESFNVLKIEHWNKYFKISLMQFWLSISGSI